MLRIRIFFFVVTIPFIFSNNSFGQDTLKIENLKSMSIEDLMNIKVKVSSTTPENIYESASIVTVIDEEQLQRYNFQTLAEALETVAGVQILQTNLDRNVVTIRGILQNYYSNKVLLMIDNVPFWQPIYGNGSISRININDVQRIEILKGPASVQYGTNAYNGVVNIILHDHKDEGGHTKVDYGLPGLGSVASHINIKKKEFNLFISGSASNDIKKPYNLTLASDTVWIGSTFLYANDTMVNYQESYKNMAFTGNMKYKNHELVLNSYSETFAFPGINLSIKTGAGQDFTEKGTLLAYKYQNNQRQNFKYNYLLSYDHYYRIFVQNYDNSSAIELSGNRILTQFHSDYKPHQKISIETNADYQTGISLGHNEIYLNNDSTIRANMLNEKNISEGSISIHPKFEFNLFNIKTGFRLSNNNIFGLNFSERITFSYNERGNHQLKFIYGNSFRSPNMLELYFNHPTVVGNKNLNPEKCESFEWVYLGKSNHFFIQTTLYYEIYNNLIQRYRSSSDIDIPASYRNAGAFDGMGSEIEIKYQNPGFINFFINYNYIGYYRNKNILYSAFKLFSDFSNESRLTEARKNYDLVPDHFLSLGINKSINNFYLSTSMSGYSKTHGILEQIPAQAQINASIGYFIPFKDNIRMYHTLSFKNINDSDMLIPEYNRQRPNINSLKTTGYGRSFIYTLRIEF